MKPLVPNSFDVPQTLLTESFRMHPLTIDDLEKDYEAVMSSVDHLHKQIPEAVFGAVWPDPELTLRGDLADLGWHQVEFKMRSSFTYTVMSHDESMCVGCVYIFPPRFTDAEAEVFLWVRESELKNGLDEKLFTAIKEFMKQWPFKKVAFPFREKRTKIGRTWGCPSSSASADFAETRSFNS